jgi:hypothetical protein
MHLTTFSKNFAFWAIGIITGSCYRPNMIVESKDVKFMELSQQTSSDGKSTLKIQGLVFHSSLAVDRIDYRREGDAIQIDVYLTPTRRGLSGSFNLTVPLDGAQRVLFGAGKTQIWPTR